MCDVDGSSFSRHMDQANIRFGSTCDTFRQTMSSNPKSSKLIPQRNLEVITYGMLYALARSVGLSWVSHG